jgi:hypothetical protein
VSPEKLAKEIGYDGFMRRESYHHHESPKHLTYPTHNMKYEERKELSAVTTTRFNSDIMQFKPHPESLINLGMTEQ